MEKNEKKLLFASVQPNVQRILHKSKAMRHACADEFFNTAKEAIIFLADQAESLSLQTLEKNDKIVTMKVHR